MHFLVTIRALTKMTELYPLVGLPQQTLPTVAPPRILNAQRVHRRYDPPPAKSTVDIIRERWLGQIGRADGQRLRLDPLAEHLPAPFEDAVALKVCIDGGNARQNKVGTDSPCRGRFVLLP